MIKTYSLLLIFFVGFIIKAQEKYHTGGQDKLLIPNISGEQIQLVTNKSVYCVNEDLFFTAKYNCIESLSDLNWSDILYVELVRWSGDQLIQKKFLLKENCVSEAINIPGNIVSGNYYIKAYTKWMQNFPVSNYSYTIIKIINPFKPEVDNGYDKQNTVLFELNGNPYSKNKVQCSTPKKVYNQRELAKLDIELKGNGEHLNDKYSVTVLKEGLIDTVFYTLENKMKDSINDLYLKYFPETRGITISGKVIDKVTKEPLNNVLTYLCIPVTGEFLSVFSTDSKGEFVFTLPALYGEIDFYISAVLEDKNDVEILINSDFCNEKVRLPYVPFKLNEDEKKIAEQMMLNVQLNEKYQNKNISVLRKNIHNNVFYGKADEIYYTKDYIDLPSVEEFFFEIIPGVRVANTRKESKLRVSTGSNMPAKDPLILIDNIPVFYEGQFFKVPLKKIERIEVIKNIYVIGNYLYSGVVSVYSKNNDFAGIDLNPNSMFFSYSLLDNKSYKYPYNIYKIENSRIPDTRNVLYWNPELELSEGKKTTISFFTSDVDGNYIINIRNNNPENPINLNKYIFSVK